MRVSRPRPSGAPLVAPRAALLATLLAAGCTDRSTPAAPDRADGAPALVPAPPLLGLVGADHTYREGFDFLFDPSGAPLTAGWPVHPPTPWKPTDFDVAIHFRDPGTWYRPVPFRAMHGTGCGSFQTATPPYSVVPGDMGSHQVGTYDDLNFRCRNHMMTAL